MKAIGKSLSKAFLCCYHKFGEEMKKHKECLKSELSEDFSSPFYSLPFDCVLKIFSYLNILEKGIASQVCRHWRSITATSQCWSHLDLRPFVNCDSDTPKCAEVIATQLTSFVLYLLTIKPALRALVFAFDLADTSILTSLILLLTEVDCSRLTYVSVTWKHRRITLSNDLRSVALEIISQQSKERFVNYQQFLHHLTIKAPNIEELSLQWDWCPESFHMLSRLQKIRILKVHKVYFVTFILQQQPLDQLLSLPALESLTLDVSSFSDISEAFAISFCSRKLKYLDLSNARGLLIKNFDLPALHTIIVSKQSWGGSIIPKEDTLVPCWYDLIRKGCPALQKINSHTLTSYWKNILYKELDDLLKTICACQRHKTGWLL